MKNEQLNQLLYEALETEMGGVQVYETAIRCAVNEDLKQEWEEYHEQTQSTNKSFSNSSASSGSIRKKKLRDARLCGTSASRW